MTENIEEKRKSLALFKYLCQQITGDENEVKVKRLMNSALDRLISRKQITTIISGSVGEGLELKGSDLDIMEVLHGLNVCNNHHHVEGFDTNKINFCTEMENSKPGEYMKDAVMSIMKDMSDFCVIHGPCLTNRSGDYDLLLCMHSKKWVYCALDWIKRENNSLSDFNIKQTIVEHGVLFVPIGNAGPNYEDIDWRISFSVAEKMLITTFSHTQLVCYTLCKILLKDVIEKYENCRGLLCSYHLKTILFWISDEQTSALWKPENLITCFLKCLQRLCYCVQIGSCPHYFLPEVNLFNKIGKHEQIALLETLNFLLAQGWKCLLNSEQLIGFDISSAANDGKYYANYLSHLICSKIFMWCGNATFVAHCCKPIHFLRHCESKRMKKLYLYYVTKTYKSGSNAIDFITIKENKVHYRKHKMLISYILQSLSTDATSGWISLASFFNKIKQFHQALHILSYILTKFTPDKIYKTITELIEITDLHTDWMLSKTMQHKGIIHAIKTKCIEPVIFSKMFNLLPEETERLLSPGATRIKFPPLVFTHFLRILCQMKLNNYAEAHVSMKYLSLAIRNKSFIQGEYDEHMSNYLFIKSMEILGYVLCDEFKAMLANGRIKTMI